MNVFGWSQDHPLSVLMASSAFLLFGILSFFELEMAVLPETENTTISIISELPGYPTSEVESLITIPMENMLSGIKGIRDMESVSSWGYSKIFIHFDWGADMYQSSISVRECIDGIYPYLPRGMEKPIVTSHIQDDDPLLLLSVQPRESSNSKNFYSIINNDVKNRIQSLDQIAYVSIQGLKKPEIHIDLDMDALGLRELSISETASALSSFLVKKTVGKITDKEKQRLVTIESGINTVSEMEELQLFPGIRLKDIAELKESSEQNHSLFIHNGAEAWGFSIYKSASSSTLEASDAVKNTLRVLKNDYQDILNFQIIDDKTIEIKQRIYSLFLSLFWGLTGAFIILVLIYRQLYPALIILASIPLTLILNFFFFYIFNITLNTISLYGMIAAIGLIADNSIVVIYELERSNNIQNIKSALLTSTLTTVIVFLPPLFIPGPTSVLFSDLVLTVLFTVSLSLPVSLFFTPACYRLLMPIQTKNSRIHLYKLSQTYRKILDFFLLPSRFSGKTLLFFIMLIPLILILLHIIPFELFPEKQSEKLLLSLSLPSDLSSQAVTSEAVLISRSLKKKFPFLTIIIQSKNPQNWQDSLNTRDQMEKNQLNILMIHKNKISFDIQKEIYNFCRETLYLKNCASKALPGSFQSFFPDDQGMNLVATDVENLYSFPLPPGISESINSKRVQYDLNTDLQRLKAFNVSPLSIFSELNAVVEGFKAGEIDKGSEKIGIQVRAAEKYRSDIHSLKNIILPESGIPLLLMGDFNTSINRNASYRINQRYIRKITSKGFSDNINLSLPPDISILKKEKTEMNQLIYLYIVSLILLFLVLGVQTGSLKKTLILYSTLIPALCGGLIALSLFRQSLNIYSFLGLLILQGTIVNSGILLLSSLDEALQDGQSIQAGGIKRLPALTGTCLSSVAALFPLMISALLSGNGEAGMSLSLMGGLILGIIFVLIQVPDFYNSWC